MGPAALVPARRKPRYGFLSPSAGFEPANLESNIKHDNYYTTENEVPLIVCFPTLVMFPPHKFVLPECSYYH
jgi:hypothetical protein